MQIAATMLNEVILLFLLRFHHCEMHPCSGDSSAVHQYRISTQLQPWLQMLLLAAQTISTSALPIVPTICMYAVRCHR